MTISSFWKSIGIISGMIIGSGIFSFPYAIRISGLWWGSISALIAFFSILAIHLAYGELVASFPEKHRLPGYVRAFFGAKWGWLEFVLQIISSAKLVILINN